MGLEVLAVHQLQALLDPLLLAAQNQEHRAELLADLGWDLAALAGLPPQEFENWLSSLSSVIAGIADAIADGGPNSLSDVLELFNITKSAVEAVTGLPPSLRSSAATVPPPETLVDDLITYLTVRRLREGSPAAYHLAVLLGLLIPADQATPSAPYPTAGRPVRQPIARAELHLDRLGGLLRDPGKYLKTLHAPNGLPDAATADAIADRVLGRLALMMRQLGLEVGYGLDPQALPSLGEAGPLAAHMLRLSAHVATGAPAGSATAQAGISIALSSPDRGGLGVVIVTHGEATLSGVTGRWLVESSLAGDGVAMAINESGALVSTGAAEVALSVSVTHLPDETGKALVIGGQDTTRIEVGRVGVTANGRFGSHPDYGVLLTLADSSFVLAAGEGDGFLQKALPKEIRVPFTFGLGWSHIRGLYLDGGVNGDGEGLGGNIEVGLALGPLKIPAVYVAVRPTPTGIALVAAANADATLGPVAASIERTGLAIDVAFPSTGGNLGPADVTARFEPPTGIGLSLSAGIVSGSGYLFADAANGQYGGAVQLQIAGIGVQAIGLLSTQMPDGKPGFSLLVLISVRFPAIQLGLGFALTAIGGLVGIHRTIAVDELTKGLQAGSLDSVLFPPDLAHNARQVVHDLGRYFPTARDQYVFGPAAEIVWGTPPLVTIQLGLFLELPSPLRLVLVGKLRMTLPNADAPVLVLRLDLLGSLDFTNKTLALDAVLRDSRVAAFTLTGSAAIRLSWGDNPGLLLAAGGFHPRFTPPAGIPAQQRLSVALSSTENPRLRLSAYFALTSNTVQIGARLDLYAGVDIPVLGTFSVSALLSFDALFQLNPFEFVIDLTIAVSLEWDHSPFLGLRLDLTLSGPNPWHAVGTATFHCFGRHSIGFDVTIGEPPEPRSIPGEDVEALVRKALTEPGAWSVQAPGRQASIATMRDGVRPDGKTLFLHPLGALTVTQKVAPLDTELAHFGEAPVAGVRTIRLDGAKLGGADVVHDAITAQFAPARFLALGDAEKLAAPSFQSLPAGAHLATPAITLPTQILAINVQIDETIIDPGPVAAPAPAATTQQQLMATDALLTQTGGAAAAQIGPAAAAFELIAAPAVTIVSPQYALVDTALRPRDGAATHLPTYTAADQLRRMTVAATPLLIVEASEVTA